MKLYFKTINSMSKANTGRNKEPQVLYFDTSDRNKIIICLDDRRWEFTSKNQKPQDLVSLIEETLKKEKISLRDLKEIEVNVGPGSFTGLKIGVAVANALGFALDIPVNGQRQLVVPKYKNLSPVATEPCFRRLK